MTLFPVYAKPDKTAECVIILHGMGRTSLSMFAIEWRLKEENYQVWNESYPSTSEKIPVLATRTINQGIEYCRSMGAPRIHFVTHSLGGILVRVFLQDHTIPELGRIIMISPPNKGSEVTDMLKDNFFYREFLGPAGQELGTGPEGLPNQLNEIEGEIGVITGNSSSDPWFSPYIPGEDDGKVSVESAKLDEMADFLVVASGHTFIAMKSEVIDQVVYFLKNGSFSKED